MQIGQVGFGDHLEKLLLDLEEELQAEDSKSGMNSQDKQEVILTCQIGGVCYVLTRQHIAQNRETVILSPREQEIIRLVIEGASNKEIAHILEISHYTVATHLRRVFAKLGVGTRAEMVAAVLREDMLPTENKLVPQQTQAEDSLKLNSLMAG